MTRILQTAKVKTYDLNQALISCQLSHILEVGSLTSYKAQLNNMLIVGLLSCKTTFAIFTKVPKKADAKRILENLHKVQLKSCKRCLKQVNF